VTELGSLFATARWAAAIFAVAFSGVFASMSLYLLLLAAASFFVRRNGSVHNSRRIRFAILIPAHNEELLLGELLGSLAKLEYPRELFDVHVVADNCDDQTATIAAQCGVFTHERRDPSARGKGHALNWLLDRVLASNGAYPTYDAFVVLDADSTVPPDFLIHLNAALALGNSVVQGFYDMANPEESWTTSLRYIAFCLICHVRRLGMSALGLSVGLLGNGMCLSREVVERFRWDPTALTEDHELHFRLLEGGLKVKFVPQAHVYTRMPTSLRSARSQNVRWEQGKLDLIARYMKRLLVRGLQTRNWSMLAVVVEMSIPPFSLLFAASLAGLAFCVLLGTHVGIALALVSLVAQCLYTARGLAMMRVKSSRVFLALLYMPLFIVWKIGLYAAIALGSGKATGWVRTSRVEVE
jgi:cellulose synthase/poly-beta-1,6-N-acetylglucosamine synthase-like glycosyltransferase